jgi:hypothetical protein
MNIQLIKETSPAHAEPKYFIKLDGTYISVHNTYSDAKNAYDVILSRPARKQEILHELITEG